jgi:carbon monoxide dehydrogenase subunit G
VKLEGRAQVSSAPALAWQRINDPEVVLRCTPGLVRLEETRPDHYEARIELKLPAVQGRFDGAVDFLERSEPERLCLRVQGKGPPGFISGDVTLTLRESAGGTEFHYEADLQIGGQIARLGQRMVSGVAKDMAAQFFRAFDRIDQASAGESLAPSPLVAFLQLLWAALRRLLGRA